MLSTWSSYLAPGTARHSRQQSLSQGASTGTRKSPVLSLAVCASNLVTLSSTGVVVCVLRERRCVRNRSWKSGKPVPFFSIRMQSGSQLIEPEGARDEVGVIIAGTMHIKDVPFALHHLEGPVLSPDGANQAPYVLRVGFLANRLALC